MKPTDEQHEKMRLEFNAFCDSLTEKKKPKRQLTTIIRCKTPLEYAIKIAFCLGQKRRVGKCSINNWFEIEGSINEATKKRIDLYYLVAVDMYFRNLEKIEKETKRCH